MKLLYKMTLRKRLIISFNIIMILFVVSQAMTIMTINDSNKLYQEAYVEYGSMQGTIGFACAYFLDATKESLKLRYVSEDELNDLVAICKELMDKSEQNFKLAQAQVKDETIKAQFDTVKESFEEYRDYLFLMLERANEGRISNLNIKDSKELTALFEKETATTELINTLYNSLINTGDKRIESLDNRMDMAQQVMLYCVIGILLFMVFVEITTVRSIRVTTKILSEASTRIAKGDIDFELKSISHDEIGRVTDNMATMIQTIKYHANVAKEIARGNLDVEVVPVSEKDVMGITLKNLIQENNKILSNIQEASYQVTSGSEQVASASQSLAQGSTEQASAIEQITASIDDITERTRINAEDANEANRLVNTAKEDATLSNNRMNEMIRAMSDINDSSENISKIIKVIDDIAFQTNILALNAAVEAARAGQHGKGFAVVAEEVRNLAGKSAQAASETAEMIEDSIKRVQIGSKLAEETAASLNGIVTAIDRITELAGAIAVASNDQATAITQIDQAIMQVAQVVQTNSATSEECAAASEELSAQAEHLREMLSHYDLREMSNRAIYSNRNNTELSYLGKGTSTPPSSVISLDSIDRDYKK